MFTYLYRRAGWWAAVACVVTVLVQPAHAGGQLHFRTWFPQYRSAFEGTIRDNCSSEVAAYFKGEAPSSCGGRPACLAGDVINCILSNSRESVTANTAAAGVLLGLLPTAMGFLGTSTVEIGLLWRYRPLLAVLLAAGSPSVSPLRSLDYRGPAEILTQGLRGRDVLGRRGGGRAFAGVISAAQYAVGAAAVLNIAYLCYQLCIQTVCSFNPETYFHPALWTALSLVLHAVGTWGVWLRTHLQRTDEADDGGGSGCAWGSAWGSCLGREVTLCMYQRPATLRTRRESVLFVLVAWATSTGTVLHIIYGTLVFSSILFISAQDALSVVGRYLGSMVMCRVILMLEISGLRDVITVEEENSDEGGSSGRGSGRSSGRGSEVRVGPADNKQQAEALLGGNSMRMRTMAV